VNARLSRSSALASKATGYPLAFIAAKLSLGKLLTEIPNPVTGVTKAFFEPALDYIVVKFPRWDSEKFKGVETEIGSSMKSVGEAMAIGRKFEEALQKAVRMINPSMSLTENKFEFKDLKKELEQPTDKRIFAIVKALEQGHSVDEIFKLTNIDKWFLHKLGSIASMKAELKKKSAAPIAPVLLRSAKELGFSDRQIAKCVLKKDDLKSELQIRALRKKYSVLPATKQIDTLAAEYPCRTNYLYLTYNGSEDDIVVKPNERGVIVLGGGAYSIGSSVEFDWCCVECAKALRKEKIPSVVINYNPETVSTDYDESDRLYFDELSLERVLDICDKEKPRGVIVSFGGQIPNNLALRLSKCGVKILGTDPMAIDQVEDRHKFSGILDNLKIDQPEWKELTNLKQAKEFCSNVGYPVLVRPSYVLSGSAMGIVYGEEDLEKFLKRAAKLSTEHPVVLTKFITNAKEIDMDLVAFQGEIKAYAISEHVENAGVHSGDATLVTPAQKLYIETLRRIKHISRLIVEHLKITGPANFQFLAKENNIKLIECNLRASRSFPFVSKVYGINFIELATKAIMGKRIEREDMRAFDLDYVGVKAPQFSFTRLRGADPVLGVEMASTGEVACLGETVQEAFLKSLLSTGFKLPKKSVLISSGDITNKSRLLSSVRKLRNNGYELFATQGTADFYRRYGVEMNVLHWPLEEQEPNVKTYIAERRLDLIINIPKSNEKKELTNDYYIRRSAADFSIPLITNAQCANLFVDAICCYREGDLSIKSWNEYLKSR
ncbi:MAG: carbamoyl-phosphate synthase large subunit, partial [Candidatus Micrarchaeota archaeon]